MKIEFGWPKCNRTCLFPALVTAAIVLTCLFFTHLVQAVSPAPDGGYAGANTAEGTNALLKLDTTKGVSNTAIGFQALLNTNSGSDNTGIGVDALFNNTTGSRNTAVGFEALLNNTTVSDNTAIGFSALANNTLVSRTPLPVPMRSYTTPLVLAIPLTVCKRF